MFGLPFYVCVQGLSRVRLRFVLRLVYGVVSAGSKFTKTCCFFWGDLVSTFQMV